MKKLWVGAFLIAVVLMCVGYTTASYVHYQTYKTLVEEARTMGYVELWADEVVDTTISYDSVMDALNSEKGYIIHKTRYVPYTKTFLEFLLDGGK